MKFVQFRYCWDWGTCPLYGIRGFPHFRGFDSTQTHKVNTQSVSNIVDGRFSGVFARRGSTVYPTRLVLFIINVHTTVGLHCTCATVYCKCYQVCYSILHLIKSYQNYNRLELRLKGHYHTYIASFPGLPRFCSSVCVLWFPCIILNAN